MKQILLVLCILSIFPLTAIGIERFNTSSSLTLVSNYLIRGLTLTDDAPAVQGDVSLNLWNGAYITAWGSNVTKEAGSAEIDVFAGHKFTYSDDLSLNFSFNFYNFLKASHTNTSEFNVVLQYKILSARVAYTGDYFGSSSSSLYYNLALDIDIVKNIFIAMAIGQTQHEDSELAGEDFLDWKVSLGRSIGEYKLALNVSDTDGESNTQAFYISWNMSL